MAAQQERNDQVFAKSAWRLIPFMILIYVLNFLDRVNVGFAALTMNRDLGFTPEMFGFGARILFVSWSSSSSSSSTPAWGFSGGYRRRS
jgi:ACS family tartrate transporter-like MFS transporter